MFPKSDEETSRLMKALRWPPHYACDTTSIIMHLKKRLLRLDIRAFRLFLAYEEAQGFKEYDRCDTLSGMTGLYISDQSRQHFYGQGFLFQGLYSPSFFSRLAHSPSLFPFSPKLSYFGTEGRNPSYPYVMHLTVRKEGILLPPLISKTIQIGSLALNINRMAAYELELQACSLCVAWIVCFDQVS
jgi:hypothetical protein